MSNSPVPAGPFAGSNPATRYFPRNPRGTYVRIARAEGVYLYDDSGRAILDGAAGAAVVCLGHGNRRIIDRMAAQAGTVAFAHTSAFVTEPILELAARLAEYTADPGAKVYFVSGGSEATETALKIARTYQIARGRSSRHLVISRDISYHGATIGALAMTGLLNRRLPYEPMLAPFPKAATCYCYRCPAGMDPEVCATECAADLERTIVANDPERVAAFIIEPVIGSSAPGVTAPPDYMRRVAATCKQHGILLIADEVMSGVGRTGKFLAMEHYGVTADITVLSKGISSGYFPLAAVIVSGEVFDTIRDAGTGEFVHGFTYAGNPVGAAVGLEVLDIIEEDGLVAQVAARGTRLLERLEPLRRFPMIGDIRGKGLMIGVELVADRETREPFPSAARMGQRVLQASLEEGLAVYPSTGSADGCLGDNLLLAPPYIISDAQVDEMVEKLERAIERVQNFVDGNTQLTAGAPAPVTGP